MTLEEINTEKTKTEGEINSLLWSFQNKTNVKSVNVIKRQLVRADGKRINYLEIVAEV